jgi:dihydroxyacetone kinase-like predicted kinase
VRVSEGEAITLLDGRLIASSGRAEEALLAGLRAAEPSAGSLVTIYGGEGIAAEDLERVRERVAAEFGQVEAEAIAGGQPLYPYIASVE